MKIEKIALTTNLESGVSLMVAALNQQIWKTIQPVKAEQRKKRISQKPTELLSG
jgi:hypothetical protein